MKATRIEKLNKSLVALLLLGMCYLGLMLFLNTSSPFLLVRGTSMEPTLHTGDLLLNKSVAPTDIKVGDVITFNIPSDVQQRLRMPPKATHRVVGIEGLDGQMVFVTQGDNSDVDPFKVPSNLVQGVVVKNMGPLGWPILILTNKTILLLVGLPILTFGLIVLATLWMSPGEKSQTPVSKRVSARAAKVANDLLPAQIGIPLDRLTSAVSTYGVHLQSHTSIIKHMAGSSEGLDEAVKQQNSILAELASVVREMKYFQGQNGGQLNGQGPTNGRKKVRNGATDAKAVESNGNGNGHNGIAVPAAKAVKANGNGHNGIAVPAAKAVKANGNGHNGITVPTAKVAKTNGHSNGQPEKPAPAQTKEERVRDLVAEIEAKIKNNLKG